MLVRIDRRADQSRDPRGITLCVPSHHGSRLDLTQRHSATTGTSTRCTDPVNVLDAGRPAHQHRPVRAQDNVRVLELLGAHEQTPQRSSIAVANRLSWSRHVKAPKQDLGRLLGFVLGQRAADVARGQVLVDGVGLHVLAVVERPSPPGSRAGLEALHHPP